MENVIGKGIMICEKKIREMTELIREKVKERKRIE